MLLHWPQVWSSCCDSDGLPEKRGQQRTVLSTDALPFAINDEGLQQFRAKRCALGTHWLRLPVGGVAPQDDAARGFAMVRTHVVGGPRQGALFGMVFLFLVKQHSVSLSPRNAYAPSGWVAHLRARFARFFDSQVDFYAVSLSLQHIHLKQDLGWVRSCEQGISSSGLGMLGKVWSTGALQVVQNVAIIPQSVHPRNKLDSAPLAVLWGLLPPFLRCASNPGGR